MVETKKGYFIRFKDSKVSPRQGLNVTKLYTVSQINKTIPLDNKVY